MGQAVAEALCGLGITVFVADLDIAAAERTAGVAVDAGGQAEAYQVDISWSESVAALFEALKGRSERLDLMVQTAAILGRTVFIEDMNDEEWRQMTAINLDGAFYCCREAVRWMKVHKTGRIILFSSVASLTPTPGALHYSTTKGGVNMFGKTLAAEVIAHTLGADLILVDLARVVSKWVGETEKNLAAVFDQAESSRAVLFFDEAHMLVAQILAHLPVLLNFHMDSKPFLSIVLVGLPELKETLRRNLQSALNGRLPVRIHLTPLEPAQVAEYVQHHMRSAGADKDIFTEEALLMIAESTGGVMRKINVLAQQCLHTAAGRKSPLVDAPCVRDAVHRCVEALA